MKPVVLLNDTSANRHHGCHLVSRRIDQLARASGMEIVARCPVAQDWRSWPGVVAAMAGADMVIINGEGTIHGSKPHVLGLLQAAAHARGLGVPTVLINSIWQNNDSRFVEAARSLAAIWVRESASRDELAAAGLAATVVPDLTLSVEPPQKAARSGILFTDSNRDDVTAMLWRLAGASPDSSWLSFLTPPSGTGAGELAKWWIQTTLFRWLRPSRPGPRTTNYTGTSATADEALRRIAEAELLISGRFHAICFAILAGTPFLAIPSSSRKIEAMLNDAGLAHRLCPVTALERLDLAATAPFTATDHDSAQCFRDRARRDAQAMFAQIRAMCR
ncbi:hypothetical protein CU669_00205 [Paramagnetospirillum kuznetsovii]|uniref:Polysaccharide pyruvyl transferase domain-containing protein n=1 Tax=Paramagnetospirillum kuznetsovii TaxID=2053833 RepID=A0A364P380_9PROT|nr:polysaccharide pyruvyl transferase family protein [Paramagnetospirillum kuznetsovii]RAU23565.1 hypothetical protein CU669_00205 [Paramagnetospirillum kuznetsovii]